MSKNIAASLYVHWPYCRKLCTYCNFNKYVSNSVDHERMRKCLVTELKSILNLAGVTKVTSISFGGGTPSLAHPSTLDAVISATKDMVNLDPTTEISMEVNPTVIEESKLKDFLNAGINRVSIGIQTLDPTGLKVLGREHSHIESLRSLETAKRLFSTQVSVDLMFGWPGQTLEMWHKDLERVLPLCGNHISLYQLTLERGTKLFKQVHNNQMTLPDQDTQEDMYLSAIEILAKFGFERYEISNFAREKSYNKHNISYWNGQQYLGIGPGAHSRFQPMGRALREERVQTPSPAAWMPEVEKWGHATRRAKPLVVREQLEELLLSALRTKWGVSNEMWKSIHPDQTLKDVFTESQSFTSLIQSNLLELDSVGLRATDQGLNILDTVVTDLFGILEQNFKNSEIQSSLEAT